MHPAFIGPATRCVADALLATESGRYLMKRRDDLPTLIFPNEWSLFGGGIEPGETTEAALRRELREELELEADGAEFFFEWRVRLPFADRRLVHITYFVVRLEERDIPRLILNEGAEMRLFSPEELIKLPNIIPMDLAAVLLHARRAVLFPK